MAYFSLLSQRIDNEKNLKLQKGVEQSKLYLELTKEWDGPRRSRRKRLVATILDHEGTSNDYDELSSRFEAVIDFFEDIGLFLKRGYLDEDVRSIPMTKKAAIVTLDIDTVFRLRVWIPCFL